MTSIERYFRLVDRSTDMVERGRLDGARQDGVFEHRSRRIFNNQDNVRKEAYFDKMTHFDFKCLLPALAPGRRPHEHGARPRKPRAAARSSAGRIPRHGTGRRKIQGRQMKHLMKPRIDDDLPEFARAARQDGFSGSAEGVVSGELNDLVQDIFAARGESAAVPQYSMPSWRASTAVDRFSRKTWGLLSLELWHQKFHDRGAEFRR